MPVPFSAAGAGSDVKICSLVDVGLALGDALKLPFAYHNTPVGLAGDANRFARVLAIWAEGLKPSPQNSGMVSLRAGKPGAMYGQAVFEIALGRLQKSGQHTLHVLDTNARAGDESRTWTCANAQVKQRCIAALYNHTDVLVDARNVAASLEDVATHTTGDHLPELRVPGPIAPSYITQLYLPRYLEYSFREALEATGWSATMLRHVAAKTLFVGPPQQTQAEALTWTGLERPAQLLPLERAQRAAAALTLQPATQRIRSTPLLSPPQAKSIGWVATQASAPRQLKHLLKLRISQEELANGAVVRTFNCHVDPGRSAIYPHPTWPQRADRTLLVDVRGAAPASALEPREVSHYQFLHERGIAALQVRAASTAAKLAALVTMYERGWLAGWGQVVLSGFCGGAMTVGAFMDYLACQGQADIVHKIILQAIPGGRRGAAQLWQQIPTPFFSSNKMLLIDISGQDSGHTRHGYGAMQAWLEHRNQELAGEYAHQGFSSVAVPDPDQLCYGTLLMDYGKEGVALIDAFSKGWVVHKEGLESLVPTARSRRRATKHLALAFAGPPPQEPLVAPESVPPCPQAVHFPPFFLESRQLRFTVHGASGWVVLEEYRGGKWEPQRKQPLNEHDLFCSDLHSPLWQPLTGAAS